MFGGPQTIAILRSVLLGLCLTLAIQAHAQFGGVIAESRMTSPWEKHLVALKKSENAIRNLTDGAAKTVIADTLFALEPEIGAFESQIGEVINRLAGDPQFSYVASETSLALSQRLDSIYTRFEEMYGALQALEEEEVIAAQEALDELRTVLRDQRDFERDVVNALGSGLRQNIVGLATRWWHSEQKAAVLREHISTLRKALE